ncbi:unnamed protein product [Somion occarium]|uniref:Transcription activator of gluconeogenesis ERT1 n=1 Tax=Somion occarium TaxID=3059160 RepID=A0ABP1D9Y1_9APHY
MADANPDSDGQQQQPAATPPPPSSDTITPSMTVHPVNSGGGVTTTFSGMPMHMYPFPPGMVNNNAPRTKRRQVKNACTNCQKACKKCDDARPCLRCVKYGIAEECIDSQRKERQKGIKRGPYKKRDGKSNTVEQQLDVSVQPAPNQLPAASTAAPAGVPQAMPYMPFPGFMQYPAGMAPANMKPGEMPFIMPQIVFAPLPGPMQDGYPHYPPPLMLPQPAHGRPDGQMMMMPPYGYQQQYMKSPTREMSNEVGPQGMDPSSPRRDPRMDHGRMTEGMSGSHLNGGGRD